MQDVHRRGAHRRGVWRGSHRHPVSAGPQGPAARLRSGRRPAQQRRRARPFATNGPARELYKGEALPHFNEVDECAGLDGYRHLPALARARVPAGKHAARPALGTALPGPRTSTPTSGCFLISGAAPPAHFIGGFKGATSERQPRDVFPARRRHPEGRQQAGLDRLEPRLRRGREAEVRHGPWPRSSGCREARPRSGGG